jgi:hypothetical protein
MTDKEARTTTHTGQQPHRGEIGMGILQGSMSLCVRESCRIQILPSLLVCPLTLCDCAICAISSSSSIVSQIAKGNASIPDSATHSVLRVPLVCVPLQRRSSSLEHAHRKGTDRSGDFALILQTKTGRFAESEYAASTNDYASLILFVFVPPSFFFSFSAVGSDRTRI